MHVNPTQVYVNPTQVYVNPTQVYVNPTQVCVNPTQAYVNPTQAYVNPTQVQASGRVFATAHTLAHNAAAAAGDASRLVVEFRGQAIQCALHPYLSSEKKRPTRGSI